MKLYLDMCCLKRPFDDQRALRVKLEAEAILALQRAIEEGAHVFTRSIAHDIENAQNPNLVRRTRVDLWLGRFPLPGLTPAAVTGRTDELVRGGFGIFDAFHIAWAELLQADVFLTVDDRLAKRARSHPDLRVRVAGPIEFARGEVAP